MCAMEAVAWIAGEGHSDDPRCACPVLATVVRAINDNVGDGERDRLLLPLVPRLVHSRGDARTANERADRLVDLAVRRLAPAVLRRRGRHADAAALERLDPVGDDESLRTAVAWARVVAGDLRALNWLLTRAQSHDPHTAWIAAVVPLAMLAGDEGIHTLLDGIRACTASPVGVMR